MQDWAATRDKLIDHDIRCPRCMDDEALSNVTVFWVSQVEGGKILKCACTNSHEFEHEVVDADSS